MATIHGLTGVRKRPSSKVVVVSPQTTPALPEAACSVNLFFDVPGYGKAQATGRGLTHDEAVANLTGTIASTRAALAPAPPLTPTQRLSRLLACWMERAWAREDEALAERLMRAAHLVRQGAVQPGNRAGLMTVRSQQGDTWYDVEMTTCTCPDWEKHAKTATEHYYCKHLLAVIMAAKLAE